MKEHKASVVVLQNGKVVVEGVPVKRGQQVEVTILIGETTQPTFPLKGLPVKLKEPFSPAVDESEWDASK